MGKFLDFDDLTLQLARCDLFNGVDFAPLEVTLKACPTITLAKSEVLIEKAVEGDAVFIVLSGGLGVHVDLDAEEPVALLGPGDSVGEISALDQLPRSAAVIAREETVVLKISADAFWELVTTSHPIALNLVQVLVGRLRHNNTKIADASRLKRVYQKNASTDPLTQLYNRRGLGELGERLLRRLSMKQLPLCLMMIDIDHFKQLNDTHGHLAGDFVLFTVGSALKGGIRPTDFAARYGGEEFTILLPETKLPGAIVTANRLRELVRSLSLVTPEGLTIPSISASFGVAEFTPGQTLVDLIAEADRALYRAKREGRDRVVCA